MKGECGSFMCSVSILPDPITDTLTGTLGRVIEHVCPFTWAQIVNLIDVKENVGRTFVIKQVIRNLGVVWPKISLKNKILFGFTETSVRRCVDFVKETQLKNVKGQWWVKCDKDGWITIDQVFHLHDLLEFFHRMRELVRKRPHLRFQSSMPYSSSFPKEALAHFRKRDPSFFLFQLRSICIDKIIDEKDDVETLVFILSQCCDKLQSLEVNFTSDCFALFRTQISALRFPVLRHFSDLFHNDFAENWDEISFVQTNFPVLETYESGGLLPRCIDGSRLKDEVPFEIVKFTALNVLRSRDAHRVYFYLRKTMIAPLAMMISQHFFTQRLQAFDYTKSEEYVLLLKCGDPDIVLLPPENSKLNSLVTIFCENANAHRDLTHNLEELRKDQNNGIKRRRVDKNIDQEIFEHEKRLETTELVMNHLLKTMKNEAQ